MTMGRDSISSSSSTLGPAGSAVSSDTHISRSSLRTRTPPRIRSSTQSTTPTNPRSTDRLSGIDEKIDGNSGSGRSPLRIEDELVNIRVPL